MPKILQELVIDQHCNEHPEDHSERIAELLNEEKGHPVQCWYVSFAKPGEWLGAVVVLAAGFVTALDKINKLGINPGGSVKGLAMDAANSNKVGNYNGFNKLLNLFDCLQIWPQMQNGRGVVFDKEMLNNPN